MEYSCEQEYVCRATVGGHQAGDYVGEEGEVSQEVMKKSAECLSETGEVNSPPPESRAPDPLKKVGALPRHRKCAAGGNPRKSDQAKIILGLSKFAAGWAVVYPQQ